MSERRGPNNFDSLIVAACMLAMLFLVIILAKGELRDLQRRVAQLESERR